MPSKLFHLDGNEGVLMIGDADINLAAVTDPLSYLAKLNFHSDLSYLQIKANLVKSSVSFAALTRNTITWSDSGCGGCYITTACVAYKGLSDDCHELQVLRHFRDNYMLTTPENAQLVKKYYETAPMYVDYIETRIDRNRIFNEIYEDYILPAVHMIERGSFDSARDHYIKLYNLVQTLWSENANRNTTHTEN